MKNFKKFYFSLIFPCVSMKKSEEFLGEIFGKIFEKSSNGTLSSENLKNYVFTYI